MLTTGASVSFVNFKKACQRAGMERTKACHPDDTNKFCRSDVWQGDLMSFALAIISQDRATGHDHGGNLLWPET